MLIHRLRRKLLGKKKRAGSDCVELLADVMTDDDGDVDVEADVCTDNKTSLELTMKDSILESCAGVANIYVIVPYNPDAVRKHGERRRALVEGEHESEIRIIKHFYLVKQLYVCGLV